MRRKFKSIFVGVVIVLCLSFVFSMCLNLFSPKTTTENNESKKQDSSNTEINEFEEKTISFLGDSITTFDGWSNNPSMNTTLGNNTYYYDSTKMSVDETYWMRVIDSTGMKLCVNNSSDGARVSDTRPNLTSGIDRAMQLHNDVDNIIPDVIIVYLGTNDLAHEVSLEEFMDAYEKMLNNIKEYYPNAEVYCCTILPESRTENLGTLRSAYNTAIRSLADDAGFEIIDFASSLARRWKYNLCTFEDDNLRVHPTSGGMEYLAQTIINQLLK